MPPCLTAGLLVYNRVNAKSLPMGTERRSTALVLWLVSPCDSCWLLLVNHSAAAALLLFAWDICVSHEKKNHLEITSKCHPCLPSILHWKGKCNIIKQRIWVSLLHCCLGFSKIRDGDCNWTCSSRPGKTIGLKRCRCCPHISQEVAFLDIDTLLPRALMLLRRIVLIYYCCLPLIISTIVIMSSYWFDRCCQEQKVRDSVHQCQKVKEVSLHFNNTSPTDAGLKSSWMAGSHRRSPVAALSTHVPSRRLFNLQWLISLMGVDFWLASHFQCLNNGCAMNITVQIVCKPKSPNHHISLR